MEHNFNTTASTPELKETGWSKPSARKRREIEDVVPSEDSEPNLIRTSSLDTESIRQNLSLVNTPIRLWVSKDIMKMTENWTPEETEEERRLVRFSFEPISATDYRVDFEVISKSDYTPEKPFISCIYWKEKDSYMVTSVDIILVLEYLVHQSFSIEEKNRVRRNLQSLKPFTILRSDKNHQRFFNAIMKMEDPRPRNIEKDLKVFKWSDLLNAFDKVLSKYSTNVSRKTFGEGRPGFVRHPIVPMNDGVQNGTKHTERIVDKKESPSPNAYSFSETPTIVRTYAASEETRSKENFSPVANSEPTFVPHERLKVIKRKNNHTGNQQYYFKNNSFTHALKPADSSVAHTENKNGNTVKTEVDNYDAGNKKVGDDGVAASTLEEEKSASRENLSLQETSSQDDSTKTEESEGSDSTNEASSENAKTASSVSLSKSDEVNGSNTGLYSGSESTSNIGDNSSSAKDGSQSSASVFSNEHTNGINSSSTSTNNSVPTFKSRRKKNTEQKANDVTEEKKNDPYLNSFAQDQRRRIFGPIKETKQKPDFNGLSYFQYPTKSQLYHKKPEDPSPILPRNTGVNRRSDPAQLGMALPISPLGMNYSATAKGSSVPPLEDLPSIRQKGDQQNNIRLPSIKESLQCPPLDSANITLPQIASSFDERKNPNLDFSKYGTKQQLPAPREIESNIEAFKKSQASSSKEGNGVEAKKIMEASGNSKNLPLESASQKVQAGKDNASNPSNKKNEP
ncbi:Piso0_003251 [Millerozyma farinosa CBS 7064]|uniref:Piso0_003251 protein n=1 Tax=Pichia sorbitophila (strain ATCC MYA-4447 / BCRC 22081 / CBS 7064 / NBRC 10061 / NRRL Y-12695) TaxID=559304 RepID=G8YIK5_PICSO|nr:Piso0_003251 [Millerozyma farinosa CBS 7064]CCE80915.1 Piso0_003251 [Millerozyma farinosa CBS 7064]